MIGTLVGLFFIHSRYRDQDREKRMQYWREQVCVILCDSLFQWVNDHAQNAFRQNILQMQETARASIFSVPRDGMASNRSSRYGINTEDSQAPMLQPRGSPSGLRNQISDDDRDSSEEGLVSRQRKPSRKLSLGKSNRI